MRRLTLAVALALGLFAPAAAPHAATKLFASGFEPDVALGAPYACNPGTACWQDITGTDQTTGSTWPPKVWGGGAMFQVLPDVSVTPSTVGQYIANQLVTVPGHDGQPTKAVQMQIVKHGGGSTQDTYQMHPSTSAVQDQLYISYWLKFEPDMAARLGPSQWRSLFAWKTTQDYRIESYVYTDSAGKPFWFAHGDNMGAAPLVPDGQYHQYWQVVNKAVPVPQGQWFKIEYYWKRDAANGRFWQAVNGQVLFDYKGATVGLLGNKINRIMAILEYVDGRTRHPVTQWWDGFEAWDGFPCGDGVPCGAAPAQPTVPDMTTFVADLGKLQTAAAAVKSTSDLSGLDTLIQQLQAELTKLEAQKASLLKAAAATRRLP